MLTFLISIIVLYFILIGICIGYKFYIHYYVPIEYMSVFTGDSSLNVKQFSSQLSILDPIIRDKLFARQDAEPYNVSTLSTEELHVQEYTTNQEEKQKAEDTKELELKNLKLTSFALSSDKNRLTRSENKRYPQLNLKNILQTESILEKAMKQTSNAYKRISVINKNVPTGSKVINLVLDEPISDFHHTRGFREKFISDMSKLTNVPAERYQVVGVSKGSVEVKFIILELDDGKSLSMKVEVDEKSDNLSSDNIVTMLSIKYTQLVEYIYQKEEKKKLKIDRKKAISDKDYDKLTEIENYLNNIDISKTPEEKKREDSMKQIVDTLYVLDKISINPEELPTIIHEVTKDEPLTLVEIIEQVVEVIVSQKIKSLELGNIMGIIISLQQLVNLLNDQQFNRIKQSHQ